MTVAKTHDAYEAGEAPTWAWPLYAFVAWLATIVGYIARFKRIRRTHRFRQDWRDSWDGLRQSEWLRDQLIAQGVAQLLDNQPLHLDDKRISLAPPASYGGPCPRSPFDMNRRFIALARWAADPEAIIRERFRRLARVLLAAHGSTGALRAAHHEAVGVAASKTAAARVALMVSSDPGLDPGERPSNHEGGLTKARGPPTLPNCLSPTPDCLESASFRDRTRTPNIDIHTRLNHIAPNLGGHPHEARETRLIPRVVSLQLPCPHVSLNHVRPRRRQNARRPHAVRRPHPRHRP